MSVSSRGLMPFFGPENLGCACPLIFSDPPNFCKTLTPYFLVSEKYVFSLFLLISMNKNRDSSWIVYPPNGFLTPLIFVVPKMAILKSRKCSISQLPNFFTPLEDTDNIEYSFWIGLRHTMEAKFRAQGTAIRPRKHAFSEK